MLINQPMEQTIFRFYSGSADNKPGLGPDESLNKNDNFKDLSKIINWRKKLSSFYECNFICNDDLTWKSVEHYYQCHKIKLVTGKTIEQIHIKYNILSPLDMKRMGGKNKLRMDIFHVTKWNIISDDIMTDALNYKFNIDEFKTILLQTKKAILSHYSRGTTGDAFGLGAKLMNLRDSFLI